MWLTFLYNLNENKFRNLAWGVYSRAKPIVISVYRLSVAGLFGVNPFSLRDVQNVTFTLALAFYWHGNRCTQQQFPPIQSSSRSLEMHSRRHYKICICSVIPGTWVFWKLQGLRYHFLENFRCNLRITKVRLIFRIDDDDDELYSCVDVFSWRKLGTQHKDKINNE